MKKRKQALNAANCSNSQRESAMGTGITVGALRRIIAEWPDDAKIKFSMNREAWALLESVSYCRTVNEVSLW